MKNKKLRGALIFSVCYIAYVSIYIARLNLSMASPALTSEGILTKAQIGLLGSVFSVIYAVGRLVCGGLSDSKPPFVMIGSGLLLASAANIGFSYLVGFSFVPPFWAMLALWSLNAFAQSMLWSSILCVITSVFGETRAKRLNSFMVTAVAVGNIAGILVDSRLILLLGVSSAFLIPGWFTLIMGVAAFIALHRIKAPGIPAVRTKKAHHLELLRDRELLVALIPAFLHGTMKDNISLWMAVYFTDSFGVDLGSSANFVLFIPVVGFAGRMIYPLLYRLCKEREHLVSGIGFIVCLIASIPLCFGVGSPVAAMFALGSIYAAVSVINTSFLSIYPVRYASRGRVASVSGIMDFVTYLGAGLSSVVYGFVGYLPMFASWAVVSVVSLMVLARLLYGSKNQ